MSKRNAVGVIFFAIVAVFLIIGALKLADTHEFGELDKVDTSMDDYIIDNAQEETGASNTVTSVVFDYRGFDTLGEATVLFTAVAGVILVFRRLKK
jgi:multisubunit Na+/H+ antiporter MnhB subunit